MSLTLLFRMSWDYAQYLLFLHILTWGRIRSDIKLFLQHFRLSLLCFQHSELPRFLRTEYRPLSTLERYMGYGSWRSLFHIDFLDYWRTSFHIIATSIKCGLPGGYHITRGRNTSESNVLSVVSLFTTLPLHFSNVPPSYFKVSSFLRCACTV